MENRRHFTRILFSIKATLEVEGKEFDVSIHDISLNGALVSKPETDDEIIKKLAVLTFDLNGEGTTVTMHVATVHEENSLIGLRCNAIDIDSISHLRRMIELNLGDESQLNKELSELTRAG